jgi:(5-formylfuran-3-yl)methyl phosphate synthase
MTGVLASVTSLAEAEIAFAAGADIIDLKDPVAGALGALPHDTIAAVVARLGGRCTLSATVGDLPMDPAILAAAVARTASLGVDIVKVGLFPGGDPIACLAALRPSPNGRGEGEGFGARPRAKESTASARGSLSTDAHTAPPQTHMRADARTPHPSLSRWERVVGPRVVAVMFADCDPDFALIEHAKAAGLIGVMLDTAAKRGGGLRQLLDEGRLSEFVERARAADLLTGLAGSLRLDDIPPLLRLRPDYLGFRGALCREGRSGVLDVDRLRAVCVAVRGAAAVSTATAAAGAHRAAHSRTFADPPTKVAKSM